MPKQYETNWQELAQIALQIAPLAAHLRQVVDTIPGDCPQHKRLGIEAAEQISVGVEKLSAMILRRVARKQTQ